jgi:DNA polymerase-3 subunit gamma/tau
MSTSGALAHDSDPAPDAAADPTHLSVVPTVDLVPPVVDAEPTAADEPPVLNGRAIAEHARSQGPGPDPDAGLQQVADSLPDDDEVDLDDLVDAPPEAVKTPIDRLAEAFPGSEMVDDQY